MDDLISRQAAIAHAVPLNLFGREVMMVSVSELENLPSTQPEIVQCKDCTRFEKKRGCNLVEGLNIAKTDSFCSYGERKDDDRHDSN